MSAKGHDRSSRLAELSVEPLSDLSWQRIERRLFADGAIPTADAGSTRDAGRGHPRWRLAAGAAIVAAAAALALLLWPSDREVESVGHQPQRVADSAPRPPSRIVTAHAPSSVTWAMGADVAAR